MAGELGKAIKERAGAKMPQRELEAHLIARLREVKMCTLVTCKDNVARGTPLEYFSDGLDLYISPDPGTKTRNLAANPNVSISIFNDPKPEWEYAWGKVWGMQITGTGKLYGGGTPEHDRARDLIDFAGYYRALGLDHSKVPESRRILKVTVDKVELMDFGLLGKGYHQVQAWHSANPAGEAPESNRR